MINYIWSGFVVISIVYSFFSGGTSAVASAVTKGAESAITMSLAMLGTMCFWSGIMEIAHRSGVTRAASKILRPLTRRLFPSLQKDSAAMENIVMNVSANLFGMGNAATPLGLAAMREMDKLNCHSARSSDDMCTLVVLNTASIELIPVTTLALRAACGSAAPAEVIVPIWISSGVALILGLAAAKIMEKLM